MKTFIINDIPEKHTPDLNFAEFQQLHVHLVLVKHVIILRQLDDSAAEL